MRVELTARAMGPNLACADLTRRQWLIVVTVDTVHVSSISSCLPVHVHVRYTMYVLSLTSHYMSDSIAI